MIQKAWCKHKNMDHEKIFFNCGRLFRDVGRAVADHKMISDGDKVLIGLSGGKDSAALAIALARLRERSPVPFSLRAVFVDPTDGGDAPTGGMEDLCASLGVELDVIRHPIFKVIEQRGEKSPCSFCANMRRGILAGAAQRLGCTSLALGHHLDDAVETAMMSVIFSGKWSCFDPVMLMDRTGVRVIRPMVLTRESEAARVVRRVGYEALDLGCPHGSSSSRAYVKEMLARMSRDVPHAINNIFHAVRDMWRDKADQTVSTVAPHE